MRHECPKCKSTDLDVSVEVWARLIQTTNEDEETEFETDIDEAMSHDHEWDKNSVMLCRDCAHCAIADDFSVAEECDEDDSEQLPVCGVCHQPIADDQGSVEVDGGEVHTDCEVIPDEDEEDEEDEDEGEEEGFCTCPSSYYATGTHYTGCPLSESTKGSK